MPTARSGCSRSAGSPSPPEPGRSASASRPRCWRASRWSSSFQYITVDQSKEGRSNCARTLQFSPHACAPASLSRIISDTLFVIHDTNRRPTQDRTAIFAFPVAIRSASMNPMRVRTQCHSAAPRAHKTTRIRDDRNLSMHAHPLSADRAHVHLPPRRPVGLTGPAMLTDPCISLLAFRLLIRRPFLRTAAAARTPVPADADYARHEPARTAGRPFHPDTVTGPCRRRSSPPRARTRPCSAVSAAFTRPCP